MATTIRGGQATPLSPGMIQRAAQGIKNVLTGNSWFGPGQPIAPTAPEEVKGRQFDFPAGQNLNTRVKTSTGTTFDQLRGLADSLDILRLVIETRKDQLGRLKWSVKGIDGEEGGPKAEEIQKKLRRPDGRNTFNDWLRLLLEDLLVLDAPAIYVRRTQGKQIYSFEPVDGATITRLIDDTGRTPKAPLPAYQQILKGLPVGNLTTEELLYKPRNARTHTMYGYSPVEQILMTVNTALRRQMGLLEHYTYGSIPNAIASVPADWTPSDIKIFQTMWDAMLSGNQAELQRVRFIPDGVKFQELKSGINVDKFEEWVAKSVCYAFSISSQAFVSQVNRATAETAKDTSLEEGIQPLMGWVKSLLDEMIQDYMGCPDLEFVWSEDKSVDPLIQAQIDKTLIDSGILTVNEVREQRGLEPLDEPEPIIPEVPVPGVPGEDPKLPPEDPKKPEEPKPAEKLAKRSQVKPINRDTPKAKAIQKRIQQAFKKFFRGQVGKVASQITSGIGKMAKADSDIDAKIREILAGISFKDMDQLDKAVEAMVLSLYELGGQAAVDQLKGKAIPDTLLSQVHEEAVSWAKEHSASLVKNVSDQTRELLRSDVTEALQEGLSTQDLADRLMDNYAFSDTRAETIANTETAHAQVAGTMEAWNKSGVVTKSVFLAAPGCCEECDAVDGEEIPMDSDPQDYIHPNCRCNIIAVLDEE